MSRPPLAQPPQPSLIRDGQHTAVTVMRSDLMRVLLDHLPQVPFSSSLRCRLKSAAAAMERAEMQDMRTPPQRLQDTCSIKLDSGVTGVTVTPEGPAVLSQLQFFPSSPLIHQPRSR